MPSLSSQYAALRPVIALIGSPDLRQSLSTYLSTIFIPHFKVIECADASEFAALLLPSSPQPPTPRHGGILRADWLLKHQTKCPAVAVVLLPRQQATGDPSSWAALASSLDSIKSTCLINHTKTPIKVVVIVVQSGEAGSASAAPLPDDRAAMLMRHSGADNKQSIVAYNPQDAVGSSSSNNSSIREAIGNLLRTQAALFYVADAKRRQAIYAHGAAGPPSLDKGIRFAFKLGALAELRGDWDTAVQLYREAYKKVEEALATTGTQQQQNPCQRFLEIRAVAEVVNLRLLALLLVAVQDYPGAGAQVTQHMQRFRSPLPPSSGCGLVGNHYQWVCRQFQGVADLVKMYGVMPVALPPNIRPSALLYEASMAAIARRRHCEHTILPNNASGSGADAKAVHPSTRFLGQFEPASFSSDVGVGVGRLEDGDVEAWLVVQEVNAYLGTGSIQTQCMAMIRGAREAAAEASHATGTEHRQVAACDVLMAEELIAGGEGEGARGAVTRALAYYRREGGWPGLLQHALMVARKATALTVGGDGTASSEYVELSLEAASVVPTGSGRSVGHPSSACLRVAVEALQTLQNSSSDIIMTHRQHVVVSLAVGVQSLPHPPPTKGRVMAIRNNLPIELPVHALEIHHVGNNKKSSIPVDGGRLPSHQTTLFDLDDDLGDDTSNATINIRIAPHVSIQSPLRDVVASSAWMSVTPSSVVWGRWSLGDVHCGNSRGTSEMTVTLQPPECVFVGEEGVPLTVQLPTPFQSGDQARVVLTATLNDATTPAMVLLDPSVASSTPKHQLEVDIDSSTTSKEVCVSLSSAALNGQDVIYVAAQCGSATTTPGGSATAAIVSFPIVSPFECEVDVVPHGPLDGSVVLIPSSSLPHENSSSNNSKAATVTVLLARTTKHKAPPTRIHTLSLIEEGVCIRKEGGELRAVGDACSIEFDVGVGTSDGKHRTLAIEWQRIDDNGSNIINTTHINVPPPTASTATPLLIARPTFSSTGVSGRPMPLTIEFISFHPQQTTEEKNKCGEEENHELDVSVGEPNGFLVAGPRNTTVTVPVGGTASVSYTLVPYHMGHLKLPEVNVVVRGSGVNGGEAGVGVGVTEGAVTLVRPLLGCPPGEDGDHMHSVQTSVAVL